MTNTLSFSIDNMFKEIEEFYRLQREYKEQTLAEIITKYDFIVGSIECKDRLKGILPKGANIICSPYIESPTMIYAIKKFDVIDILFEPQECEDENTDWYDIPADEMTEKQLRRAVKDLRKELMEKRYDTNRNT